VCEFITGGGLYRVPLPACLLKEGEMMRDAVLRDLSLIKNLEVTVTSDIRVAKPSNVTCISIAPDQDAWTIWKECMEASDLLWLIAPETDGALERLILMAESLDKPILGCSSSAVRVAANKWDTYQLFKSMDIPTPSTFKYMNFPRGQSGPWVAKLVDGVSCESSRYFESEDALIDWMEDKQESHIIQQYQVGVAASISMLCHSEKAIVLSCNQQKVALKDGQFEYQGSVVNGMIAHREAFELLATKIASSLPGLAGFVGVDLIVHPDKGAWCYDVLEINPRLTTS